MIELNTGYLDFEQLDAEVVNIADDLMAFGVDIVYVTFGFGCERNQAVQWQDIPVPACSLVQFVAASEADQRFELGASDLHICGGGVEFLLCHERDVHCRGELCSLYLEIRKRWTREYPYSHERRHAGPWHRLTGRPKDSRHE